ncbi:STAS domain-containing protein [Kitasatospora purpeofusca]|uniref:Anti-sigma factor antagonist n=1 Tax=Kitasatospora purpeofusca TaxID=67352 RepID=A0ABZ1UBR2_9ACTN|nr:STAS domain-containing protein [Kitasatospora purpeofusca]
MPVPRPASARRGVAAPGPLSDIAGPRMTIRLTFHRRGRCLAMVSGEVDLDVAPHFSRTLAAALRASTTGLDVVMQNVPFCDCCGLNALLELRLQAEDAGKDLVLAAASPQVLRLLELTGTAELFGPRDGARPDHEPPRPDAGQPLLERPPGERPPGAAHLSTGGRRRV